LRFNEDSFKWNSFLKEVKTKFEAIYGQVTDFTLKFADSDPDAELENADQQILTRLAAKSEKFDTTDQLIGYCSEVLEILNSENSQERHYWVRDSFIDCFRCFEDCLKKEWARGSVLNVFNDIFFKKDGIFTPGQCEVMEGIMVTLKQKGRRDGVNQNKRFGRDDGILVNPMNAAHTVKDARVWSSSIDGRDKWSMRQFGL
jgi:hypothetical protein